MHWPSGRSCLWEVIASDQTELFCALRTLQALNGVKDVYPVPALGGTETVSYRRINQTVFGAYVGASQMN